MIASRFGWSGGCLIKRIISPWNLTGLPAITLLRSNRSPTAGQLGTSIWPLICKPPFSSSAIPILYIVPPFAGQKHEGNSAEVRGDHLPPCCANPADTDLATLHHSGHDARGFLQQRERDVVTALRRGTSDCSRVA